ALTHGSQNTRGSLPAWEKPVDQGSNPCVPMLFRYHRVETSTRVSRADPSRGFKEADFLPPRGIRCRSTGGDYFGSWRSSGRCSPTRRLSSAAPSVAWTRGLRARIGLYATGRWCRTWRMQESFGVHPPPRRGV